MKFIKNESSFDRLLRVILGEVFFILGFFWLSWPLQVVAYVLSALMFFTSATGFCAIYALFGVNTMKFGGAAASRKALWIFSAAFILIAFVGGYYSNFFTKKFFLEDYNRMNNYYKQTLFYTGQNNRPEALANYNRLASEYAIFNSKYQKYHPYALSGDGSFNGDLEKVSGIISGLKDTVNSGSLSEAHIALEQVRPIFQDVLKRNGFSMLAISLVDFHDAMEKIISAADTRDSQGVIAVYPEVNDKLMAVEQEADDSEIRTIRQKLDEVLSLAKEGKSDLLSAKAAELKSAFVKVYLVRG